MKSSFELRRLPTRAERLRCEIAQLEARYDSGAMRLMFASAPSAAVAPSADAKALEMAVRAAAMGRRYGDAG